MSPVPKKNKSNKKPHHIRGISSSETFRASAPSLSHSVAKHTSPRWLRTLGAGLCFLIFGGAGLLWFLFRTPPHADSPHTSTTLRSTSITGKTNPSFQPQRPHPTVWSSPSHSSLPRLVILPPRSSTTRPTGIVPAPSSSAQHRVTEDLLRSRGKSWGTLANGSRLFTLSDPKAHHHHPHAHEGETPEGGELWKVGRDGTPRRMLPGIAVTEVLVAPTTERLAVVSNQRALFVSSPHAQDTWQHLSNRAGFDPAFDQKGEKLLYVEQKNMDQQELFLRNLTTVDLKKILTHEGGISSPCFHPDGHAVIFASGQTGIASLWKLVFKTREIKQITNIGLRGGGGLPPNFVPPPHRGRVMWAGSWLVFDTGDALWALRDNGTQPIIVAQESPEWFRWHQPGQQILYQLPKSQEQVYQLPPSSLSP